MTVYDGQTYFGIQWIEYMGLLLIYHLQAHRWLNFHTHLDGIIKEKVMIQWDRRIMSTHQRNNGTQNFTRCGFQMRLDGSPILHNMYVSQSIIILYRYQKHNQNVKCFCEIKITYLTRCVVMSKFHQSYRNMTFYFSKQVTLKKMSLVVSIHMFYG